MDVVVLEAPRPGIGVEVDDPSPLLPIEVRAVLGVQVASAVSLQPNLIAIMVPVDELAAPVAMATGT